ncbi:MAG: hypothetical protein JW940_34825 [Polyangiaceae bacterium]|nr:hypothetical protein [Polyangiaceae bacterium]
MRNLFVRTALPPGLREELEKALPEDLIAGSVVVRSAGLSEDSESASFAGLHDSFIDVRGVERILEKVVLVWASLWSDRALLYRQELGLDPRQSRIAVGARDPHEPDARRCVRVRPDGLPHDDRRRESETHLGASEGGRGLGSVDPRPPRWLHCFAASRRRSTRTPC